MAYNNLGDIDFFERSPQEKIEIENICKNCEEFKIDVNSICNSSNSILVFSQIKKFQVCPLAKW